MRSDVAVGVGEVRQGRSPGAWIRLLVGNVTGNRSAGKLPHANAVIAPLHGHDGTSLVIQRRSETILARLDTTASVAILAVIAVVLERRSRLLALRLHGTAAGGVESHLVSDVGLVDCLHDVDFTIVGPVGVVRQPERWPGSAAVGGVLDVEDEEAAVVGLLGLYSDGESASRGVGLVGWSDRGINAKNSRV